MTITEVDELRQFYAELASALDQGKSEHVGITLETAIANLDDLLARDRSNSLVDL